MIYELSRKSNFASLTASAVKVKIFNRVYFEFDPERERERERDRKTIKLILKEQKNMKIYSV